jgi:5'-nucleotidase
MSVILLTNDDGFFAPGIQALEEALAPLGELWMVAPNRERSACSRAVTLNKPLRVQEVGKRRMAVDGTPTDCVLLAFRSLLPRPPTIVVSGINAGFNVGEDLDYSGTVAAAAEGALQGAGLSIAISNSADSDEDYFKHTANFARDLISVLLEMNVPKKCYINVNCPNASTKTFRLTRQGNHLERGKVVMANDPRGKRYYWIGNRPEEDEPPGDTDRGAIREGLISVSMLTLNRSWPGSQQEFRFSIDGYEEG